MKYAVVFFALVAAASAQFPGKYNPGQYNPGQYNPGYNQGLFSRFTQTPPPYRAYTTPAPLVLPTPTVYSPVVKPYSQDARSAETVRYDNDVNPDGSYSYAIETTNGIAAQEQGVPRPLGGNPPVAPVVAQGGFSYTSPEGVPVAISYIADENGFQPQGNVLPVAPEIPAQIARALEYIARAAPRQ